ncbi:serine hydrolase [Nocardioides sp.]|uniref:serine hydrolase n=1 Tax=Nocardioides sp. TaxID=35761 RepID=UPI002D1A894F|nr:serine hydrolase [Nocardioides sp.]HVX54447.1 serine hydrolase [Nocardioides sp.]
MISYWFGGVDGAAVAVREAAVPHYAASLMKVPVAVAAYRLADRGLLDLDTAVPVHAEFASVAGGRFAMDPDNDQDPQTWAALGGELPLRELARRSLTHSGNLAANLVLERTGLAAVADVFAAAGCSSATTVTRGIEDIAAQAAGRDNRITAYDAARLLAGIATRGLASAPACAELEAVLAAQTWRAGIPRGLPAGVAVANKTGWVEGVRHDIALVREPQRPPVVMAILTTGLDDDAAEQRIAALAGRLWARR